MHTGLRVAGAAKKIKKIFKKRYTFKKIKHIIYVSVRAADSGFLTLAKISAFSRLGIRAGLRWLLLIKLLVTFFLCKFTAAAPRNFFKKIRKKCYTFYFFKHIIYVSGKSERTVPVGLAKAWIVVSGYLHM